MEHFKHGWECTLNYKYLTDQGKLLVNGDIYIVLKGNVYAIKLCCGLPSIYKNYLFVLSLVIWLFAKGTLTQ